MSASDLTILCVTQFEDYADPFIEELGHVADTLECKLVIFDGTGKSCIENVLDDAVADCDDGWILRLDDDERIPDTMLRWLRDGGYQWEDHWSFARANLYPDAASYIASSPLWPDLQTRLSVKAKAGGRTAIHVGSPFGPGKVAPVVIEHHKFLVRSYDERAALAKHYEQLQPGAGTGHYAAFSLPEHIPGLRVSAYLPVAA